jgi:Domain of unknown function (DUF1848)
MIVSASYRTDIPAFYGKWFMNRLRAGYCMVGNPYGGPPYRVSLRPEHVDGFVFWTKHVGPFARVLREVHARGYPFIVQHTINGYPHALESRVADVRRIAEAARRVADAYGPAVLVWRYDPILLTSLTPAHWHRDRFARIAHLLDGATDEVVISFAQVYQKTRRNVAAAAAEYAFTWDAHERATQDEVRELIADLAAIARSHSMTTSICSQPEYSVEGVTADARCVDAVRLARVAGRPLASGQRLKGNRDGCGCYESRDIGAYDTCPHGCVYCYAVRERDLALRRYQAHDPEDEYLVRPTGSSGRVAVQALPSSSRQVPPVIG